MDNNEYFSFQYNCPGVVIKTETCTYPGGVHPTQVYQDFLKFMNNAYGWDVEKHIAALYAKED